MATKGRNPHRTGYPQQERAEDAQPHHRVLMPREYYSEKHPWFGSQIHYTIDVFRQMIRDARARRQPSSNNDG